MIRVSNLFPFSIKFHVVKLGRLPFRHGQLHYIPLVLQHHQESCNHILFSVLSHTNMTPQSWSKRFSFVFLFLSFSSSKFCHSISWLMGEQFQLPFFRERNLLRCQHMTYLQDFGHIIIGGRTWWDITTMSAFQNGPQCGIAGSLTNPRRRACDALESSRYWYRRVPEVENESCFIVPLFTACSKNSLKWRTLITLDSVVNLAVKWI